MPVEPHLLAAVYRLAEPSLLPVLVARYPQDTCALLYPDRALPLPRHLAGVVLRSGDSALQEALAGSFLSDGGRIKALEALRAGWSDLEEYHRLSRAVHALGWPAVRVAHRERPLPMGTLRALWRLPGCPDELLLAAYEVGMQVPADMGNALPWEVLTSLRWRRPDKPAEVPSVLKQGLGKGWYPVERVLGEVCPAQSVLGRLPDTVRVHEALSGLVAPLGADPGAWWALLKQMKTFPGSCTGLVDAARAQAPTHRDTPWKGRAGKTFLRLLASASEETQLALVPLLTAADKQQLFLAHRVSGATRERLVDLLGTVPVDERLISKVHAGGISLKKVRGHLLRAVESGGPRTARLVLGEITLHTPAAQLALLVRLWQRSGPKEVRALLAESVFPGRSTVRHPLPARVHRLAHAALDSGEVKPLLEEWKAERSPAGKVAFLRSQGARTFNGAVSGLKRLLEESVPEPLPWDGLVAAHQADPLPETLLAALAEQEDCPAELGRDAHPAWLRLQLADYTPAPTGTGPRARIPDLLRRHPLETRNSPVRWLEHAARHTVLTPAELVHTVHPVAHVAGFLTAPPVGRSPAADRYRAHARRELRRLTTEHLGTDTDAWVMAVTLLPDFTGTLPELLRTARAVVS